MKFAFDIDWGDYNSIGLNYLKIACLIQLLYSNNTHINIMDIANVNWWCKNATFHEANWHIPTDIARNSDPSWSRQILEEIPFQKEIVDSLFILLTQKIQTLYWKKNHNLAVAECSNRHLLQ